MFTRPGDLADDTVAATVADGWGLRAAAIDYVPIGFGSHHWRVEADGRRWFVTADDLRAKKWHRAEPPHGPLRRLHAALSTAHRLCDDGLTFVVAPVAGSSGEVLRLAADHFAIAVYPYLHGRSPDSDTYSTRADRLAVLDLIARVHRAPDSTARHALEDSFAIQCRDDLTVALTELSGRWDTGPYGEPARAVLRRHAGELQRVLARYDSLVTAARGRPERAVLTHGEPHSRNTLMSDRGLKLIDWDTALRAPPERDVWILAGGDPRIVDVYETTTGVVLLDDLLALYRLRWDLTEVAIYTALFRQPHRATTDTSIAWQGLNDYLDPQRWRDD
jgi:spectinomycin phosphotransferase